MTNYYADFTIDDSDTTELTPAQQQTWDTIEQHMPALVGFATALFVDRPHWMPYIVPDHEALRLVQLLQFELTHRPPDYLTRSYLLQLVEKRFLNVLRDYARYLEIDTTGPTPDPEHDEPDTSHEFAGVEILQYFDGEDDSRADRDEFEAKYGCYGVYDDERDEVDDTAWLIIRYRLSQALYGRILDEQKDWLKKNKRLQILSLYLGVGLDEGLTFPEINKRLRITNAKEIYNTTIRHLRAAYSADQEMDEEYTSIVQTEATKDDARYDWALALTKAELMNQSEPLMS